MPPLEGAFYREYIVMVRKQLIWTGKNYEIVTAINSTDMSTWRAHPNFSHIRGITEGLPYFKGQRARENGELSKDFSIGFMAELVDYTMIRFVKNGNIGNEYFITDKGEVFK